MQIELILKDGLGESILLPSTLAIDGHAVRKEIPGVVVPGKKGRRVFRDLQRVESATLRASGTIECWSKEEADDYAAQLRSKLLSQREPMWLKRFEGANKFMRVYCTGVEHDFVRGHFGGRVFRLDVTFQADDPHWYSTNYKRVERNAPLTSPINIITVNNEGGAETHPFIWIYGKTSGGQHTRNPKITNHATGLRIQYAGTVKQNEVLLFDTEKRKALFVPTNILHSGAVQAATADSVQLAISASPVDDYYKGHIVKIVSGPGAGQYRHIVGYTGTSKVAVIDTPWVTNPTSSSAYEVYHFSWVEGYYVHEAQSFGGTTGVDVTNLTNAGYVVDGFPLIPGVNLIEVECDTNLLHIEVLFKERWI